MDELSAEMVVVAATIMLEHTRRAGQPPLPVRIVDRGPVPWALEDGELVLCPVRMRYLPRLERELGLALWLMDAVPAPAQEDAEQHR